MAEFGLYSFKEHLNDRVLRKGGLSESSPKKLVHTLQSWVIRLSFILSDLDAKTLQHSSFGLVPFCPDYVLRKAGMI